MRSVGLTPVAMLLVALLTPLAGAFPDGPFPRLTGGFSEDTCTSCHNSYPLNEGRTLGGIFHLADVPQVYQPGTRYPIRVVIGQPGQSAWGFELSVRFMASGHQAGQLIPVDDFTQIKRSRGIEYVQHTRAGNRQGLKDGPFEYRFEWLAPENAEGTVLFNAAGNAANSNGQTAGDYIYTASDFSSTQDRMPSEMLPETQQATREENRRLSEDNRVVHFHAPADFGRGSYQVSIQHRFLGSVTESGNAFGIDRGANINLEVGYGLTDRLQVSASRARFAKIVGLAGTYQLASSANGFFGLSVKSGVDGYRNFQEHYVPFVEVSSQFDFKNIRTYVVPILAFNTRDDPVDSFRDQLIHPEDNHTFALGLGGDFQINRRLSVVGEYIPRLLGYGGFGNDRAAVSGGVKIRTRAHVFHVMLTNTRVLTPSGYAVNATSSDVGLGFNIYRVIGR